jgi:hypothetical protein
MHKGTLQVRHKQVTIHLVERVGPKEAACTLFTIGKCISGGITLIGDFKGAEQTHWVAVSCNADRSCKMAGPLPDAIKLPLVSMHKISASALQIQQGKGKSPVAMHDCCPLQVPPGHEEPSGAGWYEHSPLLQLPIAHGPSASQCTPTHLISAGD